MKHFLVPYTTTFNLNYLQPQRRLRGIDA
jgi:hypothetical protein